MSGGSGGNVTSEELTATAAYVLKGKTYVGNDTDDESGTGGMEVSSVLSFSVAAYSTTQLTFTWKNPAQATGRPFSGVIICCKTGSYPSSPTDGYKYMGIGSNSTANGTSSVTLSGFTAGTTYYCRIWAYCICSAGNYTVNGAKVLVSSGYVSVTKATSTIIQKTFTGSTTYTIPTGYSKIDVFCVGGGGAGGGCKYYKNLTRAGGGGGGYTTTKKNYGVTAGQSLIITVGAGGTATTEASATDGTDGGSSSVKIGSTEICIASGGKGGLAGAYSGSSTKYNSGGNGGSGGGSGGGDGGTNGGDGGKDKGNAGTGQGTTTRPWGDTTGTVYSGGGGGGGYQSIKHSSNEDGESDHVGVDYYLTSGGATGGGKGGVVQSDEDAGYHRYYTLISHAVAGTANSGGGGGGGTSDGYDGDGTAALGANGGSGIVIIRVY